MRGEEQQAIADARRIRSEPAPIRAPDDESGDDDPPDRHLVAPGSLGPTATPCVPAMPVCSPPGTAHEHRDTLYVEQLGHLHSVTRPIGPAELKLLPDAAKQVDEEWEKLRALQAWIEDSACEYEAAHERALEEAREAHSAD